MNTLLKLKLSFVLFCSLTLGLSAQDKPTIVTTTSMMYDMITVIGGEDVNAVSLVPVGGDPHLYEPTPTDAQTVVKADLIIMNGLQLEGWLTEFVENSGSMAKVVIATEGITPIASGDYEGSPDPHVWTDPTLGAQMAANITQALNELMPDRANTFGQRFSTYEAELLSLDKEIEKQIKSIPADKRVVVTNHDAFQYFGKRYGLRLAALKGISTEADVQTSDLTELSKIIKETGTKAIFVESMINPQMMEQIAKDNGVRIGGKLYSDSLGPRDSEAGSYIGMLKSNVKTIVSALTAETPDNEEKIATESNSSWLYTGLIAAILLLAGAFFMLRANKKRV